MRVMVLLLALASAFALAADNTVIAPQSAISHKPQAAVVGRRSPVIGGPEAITIPQMLSYQGKLTDTLGQPVPNGNYQLTFRLYDQPTGGSAFWSEPQTVLVKSGLFSTLLGTVTPIGSLPDAGALYLGLQVAADPELSPRLRIASAAYSYLAERSANADLLQGKDTTALDSRYVNEGQASSVTSYMMVDGTIAAVDLGQMGASSGQVMKWNGSVWVPRNDSVGQSSGGTVTSVSQATGAICTPNPITATGTVGFDQTYGDGRYERVANKNVASGYCGLDASTKVPNARLYTGTGNGLDADLLDGSHAAAFAPASGSANYIQNQNASYQNANWRIAGQGRCSTATVADATLRAINSASNGVGIRGDGTDNCGIYGVTVSSVHAAAEGDNNTTSAGGAGVAGFCTAAIGVYGLSSSNYGVSGNSNSGTGVSGVSSSNYGVKGVSSSSYGAYDSSGSSFGVYGVGSYGVYGTGTNYYGVYGTSATSNYAGVHGNSTVSGSGNGIGTYGRSPTYWGGQGYRSSSQQGSGYGQSGTRGGLWGYNFYGDTWTFGTAGYTYGDYGRTGGVIGGREDAYAWGSLGYRNSAGTWYAGYGTAAWSNGSGLGSHPATGIGCGYGGGLMGGWLKGKYYGATISGDRYALYTKGNNYTTGYSAVMQNTGGKREASYVPTSTTVDVYTSGVAEMDGGKATVSFPASFSSIVSKDVPVVVTATPMGPAPIYLSSSDSKGFAVEAVDSKASVKFSWIAVGRRAGYEKNPEVPAELCRTDFDNKMDGVMFNENDLKHSAQPVWFDGAQLRFDTPPEEVRPPKPAQSVGVGLQAPPQASTPATPAGGVAPSTAPTPSTMTAPVPRPSSTQGAGVEK
jgi:hypothetical protein